MVKPSLQNYVLQFLRVDFEFIIVGPQQLHIYVDVLKVMHTVLCLPKQSYVFSDKYEKYKEKKYCQLSNFF